MSSIAKRRTLQPLTNTEIEMMARLGRRIPERFARWKMRGSTAFGPRADIIAASLETDDARGGCLGGLECFFQAGNGSAINVTKGALAVPNPAPVTSPRPVTYSGIAEPDDDDFGIFEFGPAGLVSPATPIAAPIGQPEWWIVHATAVAEAVVETNAVVALNETKGTFDPATVPAVVGHRLTVGVLRGAPSATLAQLSLPANSYPLSFVYVPAGSSDLSSAVFYDVRRLVYEDRGPNRIEGCWDNPQGDGQGAVTLTPPFPGHPVFFGSVRARLAGEWLECHDPGGRDLAQMAEPGAAWDTTATALAPKIAWLYLCKVRGLVPRAKSVGTTPVGTGSYAITDPRALPAIQSGALALSPTPPRIRKLSATSTGAAHLDMRASSSIALPSYTGGVPYPFAGVTCAADDAICVGLYIYAGVDAATGLPEVVGPTYCDNLGWLSGDAVVTYASSLASLAVALPTATKCTVTVTLRSTPVGYVLPFIGARAGVTGTVASGTTDILWQSQESAAPQFVEASLQFSHVGSRSFSALPTTGQIRVLLGKAEGSTPAFTPTPMATLIGVQLPYSHTATIPLA